MVEIKHSRTHLFISSRIWNGRTSGRRDLLLPFCEQVHVRTRTAWLAQQATSYGAKAHASAVTHLLSQAIATVAAVIHCLGVQIFRHRAFPLSSLPPLINSCWTLSTTGDFPSFRLLMACRTYWRMTCRSRPHAGTLNRRVVWVTKKCVRLERLAQTHSREHSGSRTSSRPCVLVT